MFTSLNLEQALSIAAKTGTQPKAYRNYKQLLDDKDITAVLIATPEHWHYQMVIDALAAGKDIYVRSRCAALQRKVLRWCVPRKIREASFNWECSGAVTISISPRVRS